LASNGKVEELKLIAGNPMLVAATRDAVQQWVYSTPTADGQAVRATTEIDVNFHLNPPE
jgi:outer membrane biosynthesis protein TonB